MNVTGVLAAVDRVLPSVREDVVDPESRMHSTDESLHLGDFAKACKAEGLFLQALADLEGGAHS